MKKRRLGAHMRIMTSERDGSCALYADIIDSDNGETVEIEVITSYDDDYLFSELCGPEASIAECIDACESTVSDCGYTLALRTGV